MAGRALSIATRAEGRYNRRDAPDRGPRNRGHLARLRAAAPRGTTFADWMINVGGSMVHGWLPILDARRSCSSLDNSKAERWLFMQTSTGQVVQSFQFTTPNEAPAAERCGKVVFSDMHVATDSKSSPDKPFPLGCSTLPLSAQEKALAFMFFNIASCVGIF